ncbi:hypothetical protein [Pedobacter sp. SYP-B3415]|uniref:hypothetical protein n=1 Tax=Pedobacter sp. SYP-B3415 TaxID=2496641 RepID=UPI00101B9A34|nr:hypothetical protein [Pedobacter sp. SYP-B3415]
MIFLFTFGSCNGQDNPTHLGARFGVFDLDKVTFAERLDTLFAKQKKSYKLPKESATGHDTLYTIFRIPASSAEDKTFKFKNVEIKPKEVVDFYADQSNKFRKVEASVYLTKQQYNALLNACKHFKDITPANVRTVHNGKYNILQTRDAGTQTQTTLYCLDNKTDAAGAPQQAFFVRISRLSLKKTDDKFYSQFNDDMK